MKLTIMVPVSVVLADRMPLGPFCGPQAQAQGADQNGATGHRQGSEAQLVEYLYGAFMDTEEVDSRGLSPLAPLLAEIEAISSVDDLLDYFGRSLRRGLSAPIGVDVEADPGEPSRYALFIGQSGLGNLHGDILGGRVMDGPEYRPGQRPADSQLPGHAP